MARQFAAGALGQELRFAPSISLKLKSANKGKADISIASAKGASQNQRRELRKSQK
jgi:hypothetical protein